jgi:hypothetical protein
MGLFQWLGKLLDDLIAWLGQAVKAFLEGLVWALQKVWETVVAAALWAAFGSVAVLYVIFYAGAALGETIMEVWDPATYNSKPSEVFQLKQAPQNSPLPTRRSEAKVLTLENWR